MTLSITPRYQPDQATAHKKVAKLMPGDVVLVGRPGCDEHVRGADGLIVWTQNAGEVTSRPLTRHVDDEVLRPVDEEADALLAEVTAVHRVPLLPGMWTVDTDLGELWELPGHRFVHVLTQAPTR